MGCAVGAFMTAPISLICIRTGAHKASYIAPRSGIPTRSGIRYLRVRKFRKNIPANRIFFWKRIYSSREDLADEHKRRPVKRRRVFLADFEHRGLQWLSSTLLRHGMVERFHEFRGATIINIPYCEQRRLCP